eukprot:CAMPEP_0179311896 /NCGR_PEP_ID=MMETSP0797-20121207/52941_1 /TAXON_ID=47934 /ORGANISM="Dinophysis acuminata, Strain DAEP01" /LENGTH=50 /DNA_ID=CAMNT_0021021721 /DNA_START=64 /DNA_END=216 /DNA_ORIENTATION=-
MDVSAWGGVSRSAASSRHPAATDGGARYIGGVGRSIGHDEVGHAWNRSAD